MERVTSGKTATSIRLLLLLVSVLFLGIGILQKEHQIIFEKAVRVCLECIGIG